MVFSCTRKTSATSATLRPSPTARMARRYVTWRKLPCWWAVFSRRFIALREYVVRVKRTRHIGTFLQRLYGNAVSLVCMFPMCGGTSTPLQKIFFLKSIAAVMPQDESPDRRTRERRDHPLTRVSTPTMIRAVRCIEDLAHDPARLSCVNREEKRHEGADHVPRCEPSGFQGAPSPPSCQPGGQDHRPVQQHDRWCRYRCGPGGRAHQPAVPQRQVRALWGRSQVRPPGAQPWEPYRCRGGGPHCRGGGRRDRRHRPLRRVHVVACPRHGCT